MKVILLYTFNILKVLDLHFTCYPVYFRSLENQHSAIMIEAKKVVFLARPESVSFCNFLMP